jgi:hypothetical protein
LEIALIVFPVRLRMALDCCTEPGSEDVLFGAYHRSHIPF